MRVTPSSLLAKSVVAARELVINSPTFIERCKLHPDCTDPRKHVHLFETHARNKNVRSMRPCVVIGLDRADYSQIMPGCAQVKMKTKGGVIVVMTDNARHTEFEPENPLHGAGDSHVDFLNFFV